MRKTIYLHVGPHKTGTTVIQKACLDNRNLLKKHDLIYPDVFFNHLGHHGLVDLVRQRKLCKDANFNLELFSSDLLLSSENLIHFNEGDWEYLKEKLVPSFDVKIIYCWRRSSLKMYSLWQEEVKHGGREDFFKFFYEDLVRPGKSNKLLQKNTLDIISRKFGKESLLVIDYENSLENKELVDVFFGVFNIPFGTVDVSKQSAGVRNSALSPEITELIRCLNSVEFRHGGEKSSKFRELFFKYRTKFNTQVCALESLMGEYKENLDVGMYMVDKVSEKNIYDNYSDQILNYKERYESKTISLIDPCWLSQPGAGDFILDIHSKLTSLK
ncbi:hypothetical protein [Vibrio agarivorans]|uniref:hypothetical protein n=1 Tax=Vibrio agarivorans TaxID=153622 RepID=UPI002230FADA|nr:hypothetical protein [Vibrio agarivorans]